MPGEQIKKTPLVDALEDYCSRLPVRLHVPGHGGRAPGGVPEWGSPAGWDVTEVDGLDDLHNPAGVIDAAQKEAAGLFGARHTFFLVNGTTVGIQALVAATCAGGRPLVLPRNAHRSVLGGLIISGARPVFLEPELVPGFGVAAGFSPDRLADALRENHGAGAVLAVHPNYYGVAGDLAGAAQVCRRNNVPLLVDEAHGTHLRFHPDLPVDALSLGADAVVQSVHKTGGSFTQASWLHLGSARVDRERLADALRMLQTTSPSYLLLASLDAARDHLARHGRDVLDKLLRQVRAAVRKINDLPGLSVLGRDQMGKPGALDHDPTRLVVSVRGLGITGHDAARKLAAGYGIYVEMADAFNIVAVLSQGTRETDITALVRALAEISRRVAPGDRPAPLPPAPVVPPLPPQVATPRRAWLAPRRAVLLEQAAGHVSAEPVAVYPPGIAAVYPGEEITPAVVEYLLQVRECGLHCQGAADPALRTIRVADI